MISFKSLLQSQRSQLETPSVTVSLIGGGALSLKFDSKDRVLGASYSGAGDIWLASLCELVPGKSLSELQQLSFSDWEAAWGDDQLFWDLKAEIIEDCFFIPLELLKAALDQYRAREHLYHQMDPLICRCFGVREKDVIDYLQSAEDPSVEGLGISSRAGMGCRTCVPQLKRWLTTSPPKDKKHYYKDRPLAEWLVEIDYMLSCFPEAAEWKLELESMKGAQVVISYDKDSSQSEVEKLNLRLQDFLAPSVDEGLVFFLRRALQR